MKKLNNKGFGALQALLVLVIIGVVGFTGYYVYNSQKKTNTSLTNSTQAQNGATEKVAPKEGSLTVTEWGVKMTVTGATDPIYKITDGVAWVSTTTHENEPECVTANKTRKANDTYYYFQGITRLQANDSLYGDNSKTAAEGIKKSPDMIKKVGDYYYEYVHGNGVDCAASNKPDFMAAFQTLQAVK